MTLTNFLFFVLSASGLEKIASLIKSPPPLLSELKPKPKPTPTNLYLANFPQSWNDFDLAQLFTGIPILTVRFLFR